MGYADDAKDILYSFNIQNIFFYFIVRYQEVSDFFLFFFVQRVLPLLLCFMFVCKDCKVKPYKKYTLLYLLPK